jgi:hypothetical protein
MPDRDPRSGAIGKITRWIISTAAVAGLVMSGLAGASAAMASADPSPGYNVFVGYADTLRPSAQHFPTPFDTGAGLVNEGQPSSTVLDGGAIRIANATANTETVDYVTVTIGVCTFDLWPHSVSLPFGGQLVLDQTAPGAGNGCTPGTTSGASVFDTSDMGPDGVGWAGVCNQSQIIPEVTVSVNGVATTYPDTGQVLNTSGVDGASCPRPGIPAGNESAQWVSIGQQPCATGAVLSLAPATQSHPIDEQATVTATLSACGTPLQGATVNFTVSSGPNAGATGSGPATIDANGNAVFTYTGTSTGTDTVTASVSNAAGSIPSNSVTVTWQPRPTTITSTTALQPFAEGGTATLSAVLTDSDTAAPVPGKTITITLGSGSTAQSCLVQTDASGTGTCVITPVAVRLGPQPITDSFAGDADDLPATNTQQAIVYANSPGGSFVVGDDSATNSVTFWGAQWSSVNHLSGGPAPASFKGFEDNPVAPRCGSIWSTDPGNSTPPPPGPLPSYLAVIVASKISQSGSSISGDTVHVIVVKTDPGYQPDPGHRGTGTVVATIC